MFQGAEAETALLAPRHKPQPSETYQVRLLDGTDIDVEVAV